MWLWGRQVLPARVASSRPSHYREANAEAKLKGQLNVPKKDTRPQTEVRLSYLFLFLDRVED